MTEDEKQPDREARVRERARDLWEQEGFPEGRGDNHWHQAEREIDAEDGGSGNENRAIADDLQANPLPLNSKPRKSARR